VKWEEGTEVYRSTQPFFPDDLDEEVEAEIKQTAIAAYQALRLRDYGRIDIRLDAEGKGPRDRVQPEPVAAVDGRARQGSEEVGTLALRSHRRDRAACDRALRRLDPFA
jgi:hypothetical protein